MSEAVRLTDLESRVLTAWLEYRWADDYGYLGFSGIAANSGVPREKIRGCVRALARKGVVQFGSGLWTDDGRPAGSGYALTAVGRGILEDIEDRALAENGGAS